jgi:hypothetical protein
MLLGGVVGNLAALIGASRGLTSAGICGRWLPEWLPDPLSAWLAFEHQLQVVPRPRSPLARQALRGFGAGHGLRRVLGFALSEHHDRQLAYGALTMTVAVRGGQASGG